MGLSLTGISGASGILPPPPSSGFNWALLPNVLTGRRASIESALNATTDPQGVFSLLANSSFWLDGSGGYLSGSGSSAIWQAAKGNNATNLTNTAFTQGAGFVSTTGSFYRLDADNAHFILVAYNRNGLMDTGLGVVPSLISARSGAAQSVPNSPNAGAHDAIINSSGGVAGDSASKFWRNNTQITPVPQWDGPLSTPNGNLLIAGLYTNAATIRYFCIGADAFSSATRKANAPTYSIIGLSSEPSSTLRTQLHRFFNIYHALGLSL